MIDTTIRLRRAVHLNDLVLVKRIIKNNAHVLRNPDLADSANTSLHLAAQLGLLEIVVRFDPFPLFSPASALSFSVSYTSPSTPFPRTTYFLPLPPRF